MISSTLVILALLILATCNALIHSLSQHGSLHTRLYEGGKGFGKKSSTVSTVDISIPPVLAPVLNSKRSEVEPATDATDEQIKGTKMFQSLNARRGVELDEKIRQLQEEEDLLATDPSVGAVPELIANRMIGRITVFFGVPVFGGLSLFVGAFIASKKYDIVVPPYIMAYATQVPFVLGLLGITYAILSSSWDDAPGSLLGIDEFKVNFGRIKEGLQRTRETAELKDNIEKEKDRLGRR